MRSYLPADHSDKAREIGSESTPGEFIDRLLDVVEALDRVLAPHGSLVIELGDTYAREGGEGSPDAVTGHYRGRQLFSKKGEGWPEQKSLCLIPESFRWALVYGRNPFTGRETPRWRARNVVRWCRSNPPVGSLGDKWRPATSDWVVLTKSRKRFWDGEATRGMLAEFSADGTEASIAAVGDELRGALHTGHGAYVARWWCDLRLAEVSVHGPMTLQAEGQEVVEIVGLDVRVETPEGAYMVDLQPTTPSASLAGVSVAVERSLTRFLPVGSAVVDASTPVCGAVLSTPMGHAPLAVALKTAEVVSLEGALIAPDRLAARLTLKVDGALAYASLVAPITRATHAPILAGGSDSVGAPLNDFWVIPTAPFKGAHYATFSPRVVAPFVLAMCPSKVCRVCGEPSRRIAEASEAYVAALAAKQRLRNYDTEQGRYGFAKKNPPASLLTTSKVTSNRTTLGWTDCGCSEDGSHWRAGVVLDPFAGSGTTLAVAVGHGRDAIGIDLDERNAWLARERCGMFLEVDEQPPEHQSAETPNDLFELKRRAPYRAIKNVRTGDVL